MKHEIVAGDAQGRKVYGPTCDNRFMENPARVRPPRLTLQTFFHDAADELLSFDRGLPYTFLTLFRAPARVVREYIDWRSTRVTKPLRYFLIVALLVNVAASISNRTIAKPDAGSAPVAVASPDDAKPMDASAQERVADGVGRTAEWLFDNHVDWALLFAMPFLALACRRTFRAQGYNFAEFWVLALYGTAQAYVVVGLGGMINRGLGAPDYVALALAPPTFAWVCADVIEGSRWRNFAIGLMSLALALGLLFTLVCAAIFTAFALARGG